MKVSIVSIRVHFMFLPEHGVRVISWLPFDFSF